MPTYVYEVVLEGGEPGQQFEVEQRMADAPLAKHPTTGQPVRRVFQPPNLPKKWTDRQAKNMLSGDNVAKHGLTRYERGADGKYVKTAGSGPDSIAGGQ
ncbi:MAG: FmdB family transcriptional regulator [Phycisphaeraceae bacterium]|nr:FmdB family transcriptional regulator [Phycisphaeraceae bacterium]